jgi:hypothetical protein
MKHTKVWMMLVLLWLGTVGMLPVQAVTTLLSEPFTGAAYQNITELGWTKDSGTDDLLLFNDWPLDDTMGQMAKRDLTVFDEWVAYSKDITSYTLADDEAVTATMSIRNGIRTTDRLVLEGNTTYTLSRSLADGTYTCSDSLGGSSGEVAITASSWVDKTTDYKIVARKSGAKFYWKLHTDTNWTILWSSSNGINTITGIGFGGKGTVGGSYCYLQFDSIGIIINEDSSSVLLNEPFTGADYQNITELGWTKDSGTDDLLLFNDWPLDDTMGQMAKRDLTVFDEWVAYSKDITSYTLADDEAVIATMSIRNGIRTTDRLVLEGDTTYTLSRSLVDGTYTCSDSKGGSSGAVAFTTSSWVDKTTDYKIVARNSGAKFYWKLHTDTNWTLLWSSSNGINTITGIGFGGKGSAGGSYCYLQYDSIKVEVTNNPLLPSSINETFTGTDYQNITVLGWTKDCGTDNLLIRPDWPMEDAMGQTAKGDISTFGEWITYSKNVSSHTLGDDGVVTLTMSVRNGILTTDKLILKGDTAYTLTRSLADGVYSCADSLGGNSGNLTLTASDWIDQPTDYRIVASKSGADFYWKLHASSAWTHLWSSSNGINTVTGVSFGGKGTAGGSYCYFQFDSINLDVSHSSVMISDGIPHLNGEPFLTIGLYHTSDPVINIINSETPGTLTREGLFEDLASRGFNTVFYSWVVAPSDFYEAAARHGLMVVSESKDMFTQVAEVKNQPNVFGWYGFDEPSAARAGECADIYKTYQSMDPFHPVMTAFNSSDLTGYGTDRLVDIAMPDPYPFKGSSTDLSSVVPEHIQACQNDLLKNDSTTCVIYIPQLFTATDGWNGYIPTYKEVRAEVYTALHYGAKGVFYYSFYSGETLSGGMPLNSSRTHWYLPESELWNEIGSLNQELMDLKEVILQGETDSSVSFSNTGSVLCRCVVTPSGDRYVLLVNPKPTTKVGILITGLTWNETLESQFSSPSAVKIGTIGMVTLSGYGVGVYLIDPPIAGDANRDGSVDVGDLGILAANYGIASDATWDQGDFNGDGAVDVGDLGILAANYGTGSSSASNFDADYAKVFGTSSESATTEDSTDEDNDSSICSSFGLSLVAGFALLGLMLAKLDE